MAAMSPAGLPAGLGFAHAKARDSKVAGIPTPGLIDSASVTGPRVQQAGRFGLMAWIVDVRKTA